MANYDKKEIWEEFQEKQNMTASQLEDWLDTDKSKNAGKEMDNGETVGHASGRSILKIIRKDKDELTQANWDKINETVGYYHQNLHESQKPSSDVENSAWYYALKNWGHDALQ